MATEPPDLLRKDAGRILPATPEEVETRPMVSYGDSSLAESDNEDVEL